MDVLGLVSAVVVLAANTHDNTAGIILLDQVAGHAGGVVRKALVDQGVKTQVVMHGVGLGTDVEIVARNQEVQVGVVDGCGHQRREELPGRGDVFE
nr:hypothetical protein [Streptomyces fuscichromogenes]